MTVQEHLKILRERWLAIALCVVLGLGAGLGFFFLQPSRYTASLQLYVASPVPANSEAFLSAAQLAQQRTKSYTALATSQPVLDVAIRRLALPTTADDLKNVVTATATDESVVIELAATDGSAERSAAIANAVGDALRTTVDDLERPRVGVAPVTLRAVQPAPVPVRPSSVGLERLLGVGLLLGLALGVATAFARHAMDSSVKTADQLAQLTRAPSLGTLTHDSRLVKRPLAVLDDPQGQPAEDVRRLRTNVQFVDVGNAHKVLIVTSALPGEGKTTLSVNLAAALGSAGGRVLLIEADLRRPKVADLLSIDRTVGLTSVLARQVSATDVVHTHREGRFDVLPSGPLPPNPSELLSSRQMRELLTDLRVRYDVILIDTSPLLPVTDGAALAPSTDGAVLLCRHQRTSRTQITAAAEALRAVDVSVRGVVLTMVDRPSMRLPSYGSAYRADPSAVVDIHPSFPAADGQEQVTANLALNRAVGGPSRPTPAPRARNGSGRHEAAPTSNGDGSSEGRL